MDIISKIALITINETLIAQIISFLIFVFIFNRIMVRPLREVMGERETFIGDLKQGVLDAEKKMSQMTEELKAREAEAKQEAFAFKTELLDSGSQDAAEIFEASRKEIEVLKKDAEKEIEAQIAEARKNLKEESEILSTSIMEKILERRMVS